MTLPLPHLGIIHWKIPYVLDFT